ncbi:Hypothetical predicted protein [Mytilus galloprovincialis]|uniref:Chromo domain-containing protein n=1 Tax=Mytilus galloprovincialis TaxID=29158 RepID=A0A8B6HGA7_MYTGA|nr:Hypothetical predicted protein [Mytilus galloprovincialis]
MKQAQLKSKIYYDKKSRIPKFAVGDHVYLKIMKIRSGKKKKLEPKWMGPYYIVRCGSNDTYKICELQTHKLMKPLVHANRLKPYKDPRDYRPQADNHSDLRADDKTDDEDESDTPVYSKVAPDQSVQQSQKSDTSINKQRDNNYSDKKEADKTPDGTKNRNRNKSIDGNKNSNSNQSTKNTWYEVTKLLKSKLISGKRHYLVQWADGSTPTWEPNGNVSDALKQKYNATVIQNRFKKKRRY